MASDLFVGSPLKGCPLVVDKIGMAVQPCPPTPAPWGSAALRAAVLRRRSTGHTLTIAGTVLIVVAVLPFGSHRLGGAPSFVPAVLAVVACFDVLSVVLLIAQFRDTGDWCDLAMSWAYSWSLVVMLGYALAFPGVFGTHPPLGAVASTAPWLWVAWHAGFPGLLGLATGPWPARFGGICPPPARRRTFLWTTAVAIGTALVPVLYAGLLGSRLPVVIHGTDTSRMAQLGGPPMLFCVVGGTFLAARGLRRRTGPERWAVVACVAVLGSCSPSPRTTASAWVGTPDAC